MLEICKICVPTPYKIGPVNCYLVRNHPYTLIDPGTESAEGRNSLLAGLARAGIGPHEIERVIITHWHSDHSGSARWFNEQWGTEVYVHRLEEPKLLPGYDTYAEWLPFLREAGVPSSSIKEMLNDPDPLPMPLLPDNKVKLLDGGEKFAFTGGELQVLHMPGHSTGHICLYDDKSKIFIAGDFILARITPNPFIAARPEDPGKRVPTLSQYIRGLNMMKYMDIGLILTGHGENISNSAAAIEKALEHRYNRLDVISGSLDGAVLNAYEVMRTLYPGIRGFEIMMGISEVFANLDYLEYLGRVSSTEQGGVSFYRLTMK